MIVCPCTRHPMDSLPVLAADTDTLVVLTILLVRFIVPLFIPRFPLPAILVCLVVTIVLGFMAARVSLNASYEKMLPIGHPYIQNYAANKAQLRGLGNTLRVVVENAQGDIFDPAYIETLPKRGYRLIAKVGADEGEATSPARPS